MLGLFGPDFAPAVPILAALAPAIPPLAFNLHAGHLFGAAGRIGWMAALYGIATVLKLGLDLWLIPTHGALGAGVAALVAEVGLAAGFGVALGHRLGAAPRLRLVGALGMVGGITWGASFLPDPSGGTLRAGALIFCTLALYRTTGVIPAEEWASLRGAVGRRGRTPGRVMDEDGTG
jgi:O-antigen/teichoic acid export membrane protein